MSDLPVVECCNCDHVFEVVALDQPMVFDPAEWCCPKCWGPLVWVARPDRAVPFH